MSLVQRAEQVNIIELSLKILRKTMAKDILLISSNHFYSQLTLDGNGLRGTNVAHNDSMYQVI